MTSFRVQNQQKKREKKINLFGVSYVQRELIIHASTIIQSSTKELRLFLQNIFYFFVKIDAHDISI